MAEIGTDIEKAGALLASGELVAIPTETVYGLAGNAFDPGAVAKIFEVKNRPSFDPIIVHVSSVDRVGEFVESIPQIAMTLAKAFWPGPLTILLRRKKVIPDLVTAGLDTVGVRNPKHPITSALLERLSFPVAAPSANPFGYISPTTAQHVNEQLGDKIKYILDGGPCQVGIESTIVGFDDEKVTVLRLGGIPVDAIEKVIGAVAIDTSSVSRIVAPGQLASHYAPVRKVVLGHLEKLLETYGNRAAVLSFNKQYPQARYNFILSPDGNLEQAAQNLFSSLREMDKLDVDLILAEEVPDHGLGRAINDRLRRAAANR